MTEEWQAEASTSSSIANSTPTAAALSRELTGHGIARSESESVGAHSITGRRPLGIDAVTYTSGYVRFFL